ncbi:MAG: NfeD family protein [Conexivisphaerales archaeon]
MIEFTQSVDQGSQTLIQHAIQMAKSLNSKTIIIEMNTPGGLLYNAENIVTEIQNAEAEGINVYTFVLPSGWAASAGSYIAMASNAIYMADGSAIGSATPIVVGGTSLEQNHTESFMISYMISLAEAHGRNATAAGLMVSKDAAYTADDAVKYGIAVAKVDSLQQLISVLNLEGEQTVTVSASIYDNFLSFLSDATVDGLLMLLGVIAILLDLYHGSIALTVIGIIAIVLGLLGAQLIQAPPAALAIFAVAGVLIFLEVKTGHGLSMLAGIVLALFGIWLLAGNQTGYSPSPFGFLQYSVWGITAGVAFIGSLYLIRLRKSVMKGPKAVGSQTVLGKTGYMTSDLFPPAYGTANIASEDWTVKSDISLKKGDMVKAIAVEGAIVTVTKVEDG